MKMRMFCYLQGVQWVIFIISCLYKILQKYLIVLDMRPRVQNYIDNVVDEYSNEEFMDNFRMSRTTFEFTFNKIKDEISTHILDRGRHTISPKAQLLVTLWYFGTPDSYR